MTDELPEFGSGKFQCPHCQTVSQQIWFDQSKASGFALQTISNIFYEYRTRISGSQQDVIKNFIDEIDPRRMQMLVPSRFSIATCLSCKENSLWIDKEIVYPKLKPISPPNEDLEEGIKSIYWEAANIYSDSPKGAAALLRLALQQLLVQIGKDGKDINKDIKALVADGLSTKIQQALDILRVVGNNAVHPGEINFDDDSDVALRLFQILNLIADEMISKPKEIEVLYNDIVPEETKEQISQRDG